MNGSKMNCVLLTVFFILALFCSSGYMLDCYNCSLTVGPCKTNITCASGLDSCLRLKIGKERLHGCYKYSKCNKHAIEEEFRTSKFKFKCCQNPLCNISPTMMISEAVFSITLTITMIWILCF